MAVHVTTPATSCHESWEPAGILPAEQGDRPTLLGPNNDLLRPLVRPKSRRQNDLACSDAAIGQGVVKSHHWLSIICSREVDSARERAGTMSIMLCRSQVRYILGCGRTPADV